MSLIRQLSNGYLGEPQAEGRRVCKGTEARREKDFEELKEDMELEHREREGDRSGEIRREVDHRNTP